MQLVHTLSKILGVVLGWTISHVCEYHQIMPSEWRKYAGIKQGKKKREELKAESIAYVKKRYRIDVNDDVADAISLGDAVCNYYQKLENEQGFEELFA